MKWCIQIYRNCYCNHSIYKLLSHLRTFLFKCLAGILKNRATLPRIKSIYKQCRPAHTYNVITIIHNYVYKIGKQFELWLPPRCIFFCWDIFTCFCKDGLVKSRALSLELIGLCLMKCSIISLQNLPYFWNSKIHIHSFF